MVKVRRGNAGLNLSFDSSKDDFIIGDGKNGKKNRRKEDDGY
jgi:hypothetical protein